MKKLVLLLAGLLAMNMANAQKTIKLFPDGAPGETQKLTEKSCLLYTSDAADE